jgi:hypothetical protein
MRSLRSWTLLLTNLVNSSIVILILYIGWIFNGLRLGWRWFMQILSLLSISMNVIILLGKKTGAKIRFEIE